MIRREQWGAPAGRDHIPGLTGSKGFGLHYNGPPTKLIGASHDRCTAMVRGIRNFHVSGRGWYDIAYNFLVCPHGQVYEGRGWSKRSAANGTNAGNAWGHAIMCLIGEGEKPTDKMLQAVADMCQVHRSRYGTVDLLPHRTFKATECPGGPLTSWAQSGQWKSMKPTKPEEGDDMLKMETGPKREKNPAGAAVNFQVLANQAFKAHLDLRETEMGKRPDWKYLEQDDVAGPGTHDRINDLLDEYFPNIVSRRNQEVVAPAAAGLLALIPGIVTEAVAELERES